MNQPEVIDDMNIEMKLFDIVQSRETDTSEKIPKDSPRLLFLCSGCDVVLEIAVGRT